MFILTEVEREAIFRRSEESHTGCSDQTMVVCGMGSGEPPRSASLPEGGVVGTDDVGHRGDPPKPDDP